MRNLKKEAAEIIDAKLAEITKLIKQCEELALQHKIDFYITSPCGRQESFDGTGLYSDDGEQLGWNQSQC